MELQFDELNSVQQSVYFLLKSRYASNLKFLELNFPDIFSSIQGSGCVDNFDILENGDVVIDEEDYSGLVSDYNIGCERIYRNNENPCFRVFHVKSFLWSTDMNYFIKNSHENMDCFYTYIEPPIRREVHDKYFELCPSEADRLEQPSSGEKSLPFAMFFGTYTGWLLNRVVEDWVIRNIVLLFDSVEKLHMSLFFTDYVDIFNRFSLKGDTFSIILHDDPKSIASRIIYLIAVKWPPYILQCAGVFFTGTGIKKAKEVWQCLAEELWRIYRGWGFVDDELLGLKHAIENSYCGYPVLSKVVKPVPDRKVVIVGNGPSLDGLAEFLKRIAPHAVIISCGSAISALGRMGIKPDIHFEIERTVNTYHALLETNTLDILREIPLVALNIMPPEVFRLSNKPLMVLKTADAGSVAEDFFFEGVRLQTSPTCTNGGLAFALNTGFSEVYLAGVDLGYVDPEYHHSKSSFYHVADPQHDEKLEEIVNFTDKVIKKGVPVKGNFRDEVLSVDIFSFANMVMGVEIKRHKKIKVFNLNDGAFIEGSEPLRVSDIDWDKVCSGQDIPKDAVLQELWSNFSHGNKNVDAVIVMLADQLRAIRNDFSEIFKLPLGSKLEVADRLFGLYQYLYMSEHSSAQACHIFRGGFLHLGNIFYDCFLLIKDELIAVQYGLWFFEKILHFFDCIVEAVLSMRTIARVQ